MILGQDVDKFDLSAASTREKFGFEKMQGFSGQITKVFAILMTEQKTALLVPSLESGLRFSPARR